MAGNVKVTVNDGWAVAVGGKQHGGGQTVTADRATADHWIARGWATAAKTTAKPAKTTRPTTGRQRR